MSSITLNYQNATLTSTTSTISVMNGSFALTATSALSIAGTVTFESLYITSGAVDFNVASGTTFSAQVTIPLTKGGSGDPTIMVTNFSGAVTITWPTNTGPQTQMLVAGDAITLSNFT